MKNDKEYKRVCLSTEGDQTINASWHVHELQNLYYYLVNEELGFPKYE